MWTTKNISFLHHRTLIQIFTVINILKRISTEMLPEELNNDFNGYAAFSSSECWQNYPFTYSKCLQICSTYLPATCLDDQLCYCNDFYLNSYETHNHEATLYKRTKQQEQEVYKNKKELVPDLNTKFGTSPRSTCHFSDFCEDLCKSDTSLSTVFPTSTANGALCKISLEFDSDAPFQQIESCVCSI